MLFVLAACVTSFSGVGRNPGETGNSKYGVLPTNDGRFVLVADRFNNRVLVFSARDLTYITEWQGLQFTTGLAQAPGNNGKVYVSANDIGISLMYEVDPST